MPYWSHSYGLCRLENTAFAQLTFQIPFHCCCVRAGQKVLSPALQLWLLAVKMMLSWFVPPVCLSSTSQCKLPLMCFTKICQPGLRNQEVQPVNQTALLLHLPQIESKVWRQLLPNQYSQALLLPGYQKRRLELDIIFLGFILFWDLSCSEFVVPCNSFYSFVCAQITTEVGKAYQTLLLLELYLQVG